MRRFLHVDPVGGLAGDMWVAALLELAGGERTVRKIARRLGLGVFVGRERRGSVVAGRVSVDATPAPGRSVAEVLSLLGSLGLERKSLALATKAVRLLARSESLVHGDGAQAHFHEVGSDDAVFDIACAMALIPHLEAVGVTANPLPMGHGATPGTAHGTIPHPAWATAYLMRGCTVRPSPHAHEEVTPTGLAILLALRPAFRPPIPGRLVGLGHGAGATDGTDPPNVLRLFLIEEEGRPFLEQVVVLETSIDDMPPEDVAMAREALLQDGALDVHELPTAMKKGRLGTTVRVICRPEDEARLVRLIFSTTSTIGVRRRLEERHALARTMARDGRGRRIKVVGWPHRLPKVEASDRSVRSDVKVESSHEIGEADGDEEARQGVRHLEAGGAQHIEADGGDEEPPHRAHGRHRRPRQDLGEGGGAEGDASLVEEQDDDRSHDTPAEG